MWNEQLVAEAVPIMVRRARAVRRLGRGGGRNASSASPKAASDCNWCTGRFSPPTISGARSRLGGAGRYEAHLHRRARARMERDELRRGVSLVGPQRDDVRFLIDGVDARTFASQGQQRTAVLR